MTLKFRLKGLAETFIDNITCPNCSITGTDDECFSTQLTKVTLEGIVVVMQCKSCREIFVPNTQRLGIINPRQLKKAIEKDSKENGEVIVNSMQSVVLNAEKLNAERKDIMH